MEAARHVVVLRIGIRPSRGRNASVGVLYIFRAMRCHLPCSGAALQCVWCADESRKQYRYFIMRPRQQNGAVKLEALLQPSTLPRFILLAEWGFIVAVGTAAVVQPFRAGRAVSPVNGKIQASNKQILATFLVYSRPALFLGHPYTNENTTHALLCRFHLCCRFRRFRLFHDPRR